MIERISSQQPLFVRRAVSLLTSSPRCHYYASAVVHPTTPSFMRPKVPQLAQPWCTTARRCPGSTLCCLSTAASSSSSSVWRPSSRSSSNTTRRRRYGTNVNGSFLDEQQQQPLVTVCIVGPPNAGKSTLFNRLLCKESNKSYRLAVDKKKPNTHNNSKKQQNRHSNNNKRTSTSQKIIGTSTGTANHQQGGMAIISPTAGTTRDRRECIGRIGGTMFRLWDTAGVEGALTTQQLFVRTSSSSYSRMNNINNNNNPATAPKSNNNVQTQLLLHEQVRYDMMHQTMRAASMSDLVLLMVDAKNTSGITADVLETAKWLRKIIVSVRKQQQRSPITATEFDSDSHDEASQRRETIMKPRIVVLANKLEGNHWNYNGSPILEQLDELQHKLGFGEPIPISAYHGEGMDDIAILIEQLQQHDNNQHLEWEQQQSDSSAANDTDQSQDDADSSYNNVMRSSSSKVSKLTKTRQHGNEKPLQLAILGRQNVGKSTLVNALLGHERVIAGEMPGLTRDAIAINWKFGQRPVQIVDTAGIRKRQHRDHSDTIEDLAVQDAMRAMKVADIAVLVLDAEARMLQRQELAIADAVLKEGRALVIVANKMDLIVEADYTKEDFVSAVRQQLEGRFPILRNTPIVAMSSLTGECVDDLMPVVFDARDRWAQKLSTGKLNRWIANVVDIQSPPTVRGKAVKIKYMMQTKGRPPTFLLFCSTDEMPESYTRYLIRHFQDTFQMYGMEIRLAIKKAAPENPYDNVTKSKRVGFGLGGHAARKARVLQQRQQLFRGCTTKEEGRVRQAKMRRHDNNKHKRRRRQVI